MAETMPVFNFRATSAFAVIFSLFSVHRGCTFVDKSRQKTRCKALVYHVKKLSSPPLFWEHFIYGNAARLAVPGFAAINFSR